jgi:two-component system, response regulator, stage 0 sporulation protein F
MHKVLVVDDEENILKLYSMELGMEGFDVRVANCGEDAIQSVKDDIPDIVVLDVQMNDKDGLEVLAELKVECKDLPIVLNTAYSTYKNNFQSWLAEDYVVKSADLSELKQKIREILRI